MWQYFGAKNWVQAKKLDDHDWETQFNNLSRICALTLQPLDLITQHCIFFLLRMISYSLPLSSFVALSASSCVGPLSFFS